MLAYPPKREKRYLDWPEERSGGTNSCHPWIQAASNICLDFHGDPFDSPLVLFSDGNHHMALGDCIHEFLLQNRGLSGIFYTTTPPGALVAILRSGGVQIGNLTIRVSPHVLISPPLVLDKLISEGYLQKHEPFVQNRGSVLLVKKGNPLNICSVADLLQARLRLFLSNPETETVSHRGYVATLTRIAAREGVDLSLAAGAGGPEIIYGDSIHHREAPQALADGRADVAIVYYHLALRYLRIFPSLFDMIPLGGTAMDPQPVVENVISQTHVGIIGDGGDWGAAFIRFLASERARKIYSYHGLTPAG